MAKVLTAEMEAELVGKAQAGDLEAFGEIVLCYRAGTINVVYRLCGDAALAEDAAQSAFVKAWQNLQDYRQRGAFRGWLYRIAVNTALDILRKEKRIVELEQMPQISSEEDPKAIILKKERQEQVQRAVLSLPPASRSVLVLREYEGLSYQEIAEALEIPIGTVMSRLNYARKRLLESLRPYLEVA